MKILAFISIFPEMSFNSLFWRSSRLTPLFLAGYYGPPHEAKDAFVFNGWQQELLGKKNTSNNIFEYRPVIEEHQAAAEAGNPKFVAAVTSQLHDFLQQHSEDWV